MDCKSYLKILRPVNLLIILVTQILFYQFVIKTHFSDSNIELLLNQNWNLIGLILSMLIISGTGFIINDILDEKIDLINKGELAIIPNKISINNAFKYYYLLISVGALVSLKVAFDINNLALFIIYPIAIFILWLYSKKLKFIPLIGNLVVALFTVIVIFILLFAERQAINELQIQLPSQYENFINISILLMALNFLANFSREIIKDVEDLEGDLENGSQSIVITQGIKFAKSISIFCNLLILAFLIYWIDLIEINSWIHGFSIAILIFTTAINIYYISYAQTKSNFHFSSQVHKFLMLVGLFYIIIFSIFS